LKFNPYVLRASRLVLSCPEGRAGRKNFMFYRTGQDKARHDRATGQGRTKKSAL